MSTDVVLSEYALAAQSYLEYVRSFLSHDVLDSDSLQVPKEVDDIGQFLSNEIIAYSNGTMPDWTTLSHLAGEDIVAFIQQHAFNEDTTYKAWQIDMRAMKRVQPERTRFKKNSA